MDKHIFIDMDSVNLSSTFRMLAVYFMGCGGSAVLVSPPQVLAINTKGSFMLKYTLSNIRVAWLSGNYRAHRTSSS
jgi:hypothetical protein